MDQSTEVLRYTYRLRPGVQATAALEAEWGRCRWLWNEAVHQWQAGRKPTRTKLGKLLTAARAQNTWLRDGSQNAQQCVLNAFTTTLDQSFKVKGRGRPKPKTRKKTRPSLEFTTRGFAIRGGRLRLYKTADIPVIWHRELPQTPTSVRVYQDSLGHWYASFVVRRERQPLPEVTGGIGIDWGVKVTATTTNPDYDLPFVGARKKAAGDLAAAQRKMARRYKPSGPQTNGYKRAKHEAAVVAKTAQRRNTHEAHCWAKRVVTDHQLIAVEDFKPTFLAKSTMARKAADAAIGTMKRTLIEYAERAGRKVVLVQPAYTTMTCHACGTRAKERLLLDDRVFVCIACGLVDDRDRNAARVILAAAERGRTSVESVRHLDPPFEVSGAA